MEEYDQREIVDLAVAAANSLTPSSLHDNIILNNNNNYKGQQRALVNYDDTTAGTEDDMSLLESLPVIYDFESNEEQRRIQNTNQHVFPVSEYCMLQAANPANGKLVCTAQDIKFSEVTGFNILDGQNLEACNCTTVANSTDPACVTPLLWCLSGWQGFGYDYFGNERKLPSIQ